MGQLPLEQGGGGNGGGLVDGDDGYQSEEYGGLWLPFQFFVVSSILLPDNVKKFPRHNKREKNSLFVRKLCFHKCRTRRW